MTRCCAQQSVPDTAFSGPQRREHHPDDAKPTPIIAPAHRPNRSPPPQPQPTAPNQCRRTRHCRFHMRRHGQPTATAPHGHVSTDEVGQNPAHARSGTCDRTREAIAASAQLPSNRYGVPAIHRASGADLCRHDSSPLRGRSAQLAAVSGGPCLHMSSSVNGRTQSPVARNPPRRVTPWSTAAWRMPAFHRLSLSHTASPPGRSSMKTAEPPPPPCRSRI